MSAPLPCDGVGAAILAVLDDAGVPRSAVARWSGGVDDSLVSAWRSGARSMPVWALRRVLRYVTPSIAAQVLREIAPDGVTVSVEARAEGAPSLAVVAADLGIGVAALQRDIAVLQEGRRVRDEDEAGLLNRIDALALSLARVRAAASGGVR